MRKEANRDLETPTDRQVGSLIKHMTPVRENKEKLNELTKNWDTLSLCLASWEKPA